MKSPCLGCSREGEDKRACSEVCKRIHAYQMGRPYADLPAPAPEEYENIMIEDESEAERGAYQHKNRRTTASKGECLDCKTFTWVNRTGLCPGCRKIRKNMSDLLYRQF